LAVRAVNNPYIFSVLCLSHIIYSIRKHFCSLEPLTSNLPWHIFSYYCLDFFITHSCWYCTVLIGRSLCLIWF